MTFKVSEPAQTFRSIAEPVRRWAVNLNTVAILAVALIIPLTGWMNSLSNRVSVLESDAKPLQTAAVQIAAMNQRLIDLQNDFDQLKIELRTRPEYGPVQSPR